MSFAKKMPTVVPVENFNAAVDAVIMRNSVKGAGTDEEAIFFILANRSFNQRLSIAEQYNIAYERHLLADLKSDLTGKLEELGVALLTPPNAFLAKELKRSLAGPGTDEATLVEILATYKSNKIRDLKTAYENLFESKLEDDIRSDASDHFRLLLATLLVGDRSLITDSFRAMQTAKLLLSASAEDWIRIFCESSFGQLKLIISEYRFHESKPIEEAIETQFSGDLQMGLLAIVKIAKNTPGYFAGRLYNAGKGLGTNEHTIMRIVVSRSEIDAQLIKEEFETTYDKTLKQFLEEEFTSTEYKKALFQLLKL